MTEFYDIDLDGPDGDGGPVNVPLSDHYGVRVELKLE